MNKWSYKKWINTPDTKVVTREGKKLTSLGWYANTFVGCIEEGGMLPYDEKTGKPFGASFTERLFGTKYDLFFDE